MRVIKRSLMALGLVLMMTSCADKLETTNAQGNKTLGGGSCNDGCCGSGCGEGIDPFISVTDEMCISGDGFVNVSWTNPSIYPLPDKILVLRKTNEIVGPNGQGSNPGHPLDPFAEVIYFGAPTNFIQDLEVMNHTWYHYGIWWANEVGVDANGEPMYEYSAQGSFCQAYPCGPMDNDNVPDDIDDPVIITPGDGAICLDWQLPDDSSVTGVVVYRSPLPFVGEPKDDPNALIIFQGTGTELVDADVINDEPYYYAIYTVNMEGVLSATAVAVSETPTSVLPTPEEVVKLTASNATSEDNYGHATDIQGNLMVVGADLASTDGLVYIYERTPNSPLTSDDDVWTEVQILSEPSAGEVARFGEEVFISPDQDLIIVGAPFKDLSSSQPEFGAVYIFEKNVANNLWERTHMLTASNAFDYDRLGAEFEYSKDDQGNEVLAIGAEYANTGSTFNTGRVYIFEKQGNAWVETAIIESPETTANFYFGGEIESFDGKVAVNGGDQVFVLNKVNSVWTIVQTITGDDTVVGDGFGHEISIDGDMMVISANKANNDALSYTNSGAAYAFAKNAAGLWVQQQKLLPAVSQSYDSFGEDIDLSGNLLVVGNDQYDGSTATYGAQRTGNITIFRFDNGVWSELGSLTTSDAQDFDWAGEEVRISGTTLIVGASQEDGGAGDLITDAGAAYVFDITSIVNLCVAPDAPNPAPITGTYNSVPAAPLSSIFTDILSEDIATVEGQEIPLRRSQDRTK